MEEIDEVSLAGDEVAVNMLGMMDDGLTHNEAVVHAKLRGGNKGNRI